MACGDSFKTAEKRSDMMWEIVVHAEEVIAHAAIQLASSE